MPEDVAKQRIAAQNPQADKLAKADVVIKNDDNVEETWKQVQSAWEQIKTILTQQATSTAETIPSPPKPQPVATQPPAAAAPTQPSPAVSAPPTAPVVPTVPATPAPAPSGDISVEVRRGMPGNAELIANFITRVTTKEVSRMDIMLAFGQKSYLFAEDGAGNQIGVIGWQVENLITSTDEIYLQDNVPPLPLITALMTAIEDASTDLQSEVSFIFLPHSTADSIIEAFTSKGYVMTTVKDIKIPAWREAVQDVMNAAEGVEYRILTKKLREDRVLQPL
jgi:hypothetical protein